MVVLRILFEMNGELIYLARDHADLDLGRAGVLVVFLMFPDDPGFNAFSKHWCDYNSV